MQPPRSPALVLIADDNPLNIEVLCGALAGEGLNLAMAGDGEEVLAVVGREEPDLILLDALMPGLDGFETCKRLKANPATRDIPVVFMTALADEHYRIQGFSVGAVDYVIKPFERGELLARVRTQLSLRSATRALKEQNLRLSEEIRERDAAERALERRTAELYEANAQLAQELSQREQAEAARAALHEQIIAAQRDRLRELSAPLIPITDGILVMPLVGTMDVERARQAVDTALRGASERGADFLIFDITGVNVADETVASMLVQAARGLGLLGTRAIITGIRPEVAQALVRLALGLGELVTKATVQAGVAHALRARGRAFGAP
ncbi:response regulator [Sorangium sp. So ce590]|uniref:response regulator n=1 Tax=unclassified Sorangium TaxID=2621164 RepID=UPI003F5FE502